MWEILREQLASLKTILLSLVSWRWPTVPRAIGQPSTNWKRNLVGKSNKTFPLLPIIASRPVHFVPLKEKVFNCKHQKFLQCVWRRSHEFIRIVHHHKKYESLKTHDIIWCESLVIDNGVIPHIINSFSTNIFTQKGKIYGHRTQSLFVMYLTAAIVKSNRFQSEDL